MGSATVLDEATLEEAHARLERPVYNVVYRWLWDVEDSHEVVQEAFLRLWRMRDRVDVSRLDPLVYRIALNLARSLLRRRRVWRWTSLEPLRRMAAPGTSPEEQLLRASQNERVRRAPEALPIDLRRALVLAELSSLTHAQIAETLGIAPGTVASRRHRALKRLRESLEADEL